MSLRKYPYPYRAALTICSDIDQTTPDAFLEIHRFLNTTHETSMGPGVGLEIGDSFWMYAAGPHPEQRLAYFAGLDPVEGPWAGLIRDFIRAGYLDCLHTYGDFNHYGGFQRELAVQGVRQFQDQGLRLDVWTNHGDRHNFQNIHEPWSLGDVAQTRYADGDQRDTAEYHMDLSRSLGIRFCWRSADLTQVWGQGRPLRLGDLCPWERLRHPRTWLRWLGPTLRAGVGSSGANALLEPVALRDGSSLYAFKRYGRFSQDRADDLGSMLSEQHLAQLIRDEAAAILYTHLGKRLNPSGPVIPEAAQAGLRRLARASQDGRIYVTTTSRLLRYCLARDQLRYAVAERAASLDITIDPGVDAAHLQGMTFYAEHAKPLRLLLGEQELPLRRNPPDHTGRPSVSIPPAPLSPEPLARYFVSHG
ncbi:MAG: hypothetical protein HYY91_00080 [Candidatus Omnitrophica bacterium]|nr:hypothetical protein [Candidatus Omnitrophota bacterium]